MLSKKTIYAIRALVSLADAYPGAMTTGGIVEAEKLPRKFLESILIELKRAGITASVRGREGGHRLARPPSAISLAEIIRTLDGPLAMMPCASVTSYRPCGDCRDVEKCRIRLAFAKGRDAVASVFEATTLEDMKDEPGSAAMLASAG